MPHLKGHIIGTGSQQVALWIPLDGVDLVGVTLEGLDGFVLPQLTHVDALVSGTRSEGGVGLPVHVQGRSGVEGKLLRTVA